jgi:hypothetical protein
MNTELSPRQLEALERNQYKPGQSGNPGGASALRSLTAALREKLAKTVRGKERQTVAEALADKLIKLAFGGSVAAHQLIFERVEGKLSERVTVATDQAMRLLEAHEQEERRQAAMTPEEEVADCDEQIDQLRKIRRVFVIRLNVSEPTEIPTTVKEAVSRIDAALSELIQLSEQFSEHSIVNGLIAIGERLDSLRARAEEACGVSYARGPRSHTVEQR